jgi:hypothetical protein
MATRTIASSNKSRARGGPDRPGLRPGRRGDVIGRRPLGRGTQFIDVRQCQENGWGASRELPVRRFVAVFARRGNSPAAWPHGSNGEIGRGLYSPPIRLKLSECLSEISARTPSCGRAFPQRPVALTAALRAAFTCANWVRLVLSGRHSDCKTRNKSRELPVLYGRPDERQTCLCILGFSQMRRAFRDDLFQRGSHMCRAEVSSLGAAVARAEDDWIWSAGLPCGLSATSPISAATSTCSWTGI